MNLLQKPFLTKALGYSLSARVLHLEEPWKHAWLRSGDSKTTSSCTDSINQFPPNCLKDSLQLWLYIKSKFKWWPRCESVFGSWRKSWTWQSSRAVSACVLGHVPAAACPSESLPVGIAGMVLAFRAAAAGSCVEGCLHQLPLGIELNCLSQVLLRLSPCPEKEAAPMVKSRVDTQTWVCRAKQSVLRPTSPHYAHFISD